MCVCVCVCVCACVCMHVCVCMCAVGPSVESSSLDPCLQAATSGVLLARIIVLLAGVIVAIITLHQWRTLTQ